MSMRTEGRASGERSHRVSKRRNSWGGEGESYRPDSIARLYGKRENTKREREEKKEGGKAEHSAYRCWPEGWQEGSQKMATLLRVRSEGANAKVSKKIKGGGM